LQPLAASAAWLFPFPDQRCKLFTLVVAQSHNILYDNFLLATIASVVRVAMNANHQILFKFVEATHYWWP
jgi:hypothetical protein